jgi:alpha/beta superfamily hydrolase
MDLTVAAARLLEVTIPGPAGALEGLLRLPPEPAGTAVVAHPHPQHGGTLHSKVVHRATRLLSGAFRLASLRFNFRGVGASAGHHDGGPGETEDLEAAAAWLRARHPGGPFVLSGFSFGSICALNAVRRLDPDVLFLIGVPLGLYPVPPHVSPRVRVFWIQGEADAFSPVAAARAIAGERRWDLAVVPGADHFFTRNLGVFESEALRGVARALERETR